MDLLSDDDQFNEDVIFSTIPSESNDSSDSSENEDEYDSDDSFIDNHFEDNNNDEEIDDTLNVPCFFGQRLLLEDSDSDSNSNEEFNTHSNLNSDDDSDASSSSSSSSFPNASSLFHHQHTVPSFHSNNSRRTQNVPNNTLNNIAPNPTPDNIVRGQNEIVDINTFQTSSSVPQQSIINQMNQIFIRSLPDFIQSQSPAQMGLGYRLFWNRNPRTTPSIPEGFTPFYDHICLTIDKDDLVPGAKNFGDFNLETEKGKNKCRLFQFMRFALLDPRNGTDMHFKSAFTSTRGTDSCVREDGRAIVQKVITVCEPLFKEVFYIDGLGPHRPGQPSSHRHVAESEMLNIDNINGYRVHFFITDPSINAMDCVIKRIRDNIDETGEGQEWIPINEDDDHVKDVYQRWLNKDPMKLMAYMSRINNEVAKKNQKMLEKKKNFQRNQQSAANIRSLSYEIQSLTDFYNLGRKYECRCIFCKKEISCPRCQTLEVAHDKIAEGGSVVHNPEEVSFEKVKYKILMEGHAVSVSLNACIYSNDTGDNTLRTYAYAFTNPSHFLRYDNPTTLKIMQGIGICNEQIEPANYLDYRQPANQVIRFAFPSLVFTFGFNVFGNKDLIDTPFPWAYDHFSILCACVDEIIAEKKVEEEIDTGSHFFTMMTNGSDERVIQKIMIQNREALASLPDEIPIEVRGVPATLADQQFAKCYVPIQNMDERYDPTTIRGNDDLIDAAYKTKANIMRLREYVRFIDEESIRYLYSILQRQGMRELKRIATLSSSNTPLVFKNAVKLLNNLTMKQTSAYSRIGKVARNMDSYSSDYLVQNYLYFETAGVLHTHSLVLNIILAARRATHSHIIDDLYGFTMLVNNYMVNGTGGAGKSFSTTFAATQSLRNSFEMRTSQSACAPYNPCVEDCKMVVFDEKSPEFDSGAKQTPEQQQKSSEIKQRATSHELTRKITKMVAGADGRNEDIAKRTTVSILSIAHYGLITHGNKIESKPGCEDSMESRFGIYFINGNQVRRDGVSKNTARVNQNSADIFSLTAADITNRRNTMHTTHAIHSLYEKLVATGGAIPPSVATLSLLFSMVMETLGPTLPHMRKNPRAAERLYSKALTYAVEHGIYLIYNSLWSPLLTIDVNARRVSYAPFNIDQLSLIQPVTFLCEDAAISLIVQEVFESYMPSLYWKIAMMIAINYGSYNDVARRQYKQDPFGNQINVDTNYIVCPVKLGQILSYLAEEGINVYTARYCIRALANLQICIPQIQPRPLQQLGAPDVYSTYNILSNAATIHVPQNGHRYIDDKMEFDDSHLSINIHYLDKFSPAGVLKMVMDAMSYKGIRERRVALAINDEDYPYLPFTWDIKQGTHIAKMPTNGALNDQISKIIFSNSGYRGNSRRSQESVPIADLERVNAEDALCEDFLRKNPVYTGNDTSFYYPSNINKVIAERERLLFSNDARIVYPEDCIAASPQARFSTIQEQCFIKYDRIPAPINPTPVIQISSLENNEAFDQEIQRLHESANISYENIPSSSSSSYPSPSSSSSSSSSSSLGTAQQLVSAMAAKMNAPPRSKSQAYHVRTGNEAPDPKRQRVASSNLQELISHY